MNNTVTYKRNKVKNMCIASLLIALSLILANVKIFSTIALDSLPAFLGAIIISPIAGGIIALLGHMFTALTSGFPLTLPLHIMIAVEMLIVAYVFGWVYRRANVIIAIIVATVLNGVVFTYISGIIIEYMSGVSTSLILSITTPSKFFMLMVIPLTLGAFINIVIAYIISKVIKHASI